MFDSQEDGTALADDPISSTEADAMGLAPAPWTRGETLEVSNLPAP